MYKFMQTRMKTRHLDLSIELVESGDILTNRYYDGYRIMNFLTEHGYTNLGWRNEYYSKVSRLSRSGVDTVTGFTKVYYN